MRAYIVHDKTGQIRWLTVQDAEIEGELEVEAGEGETVLSIELADADTADLPRGQRAQRVADELLGGFKVDVAQRRLVAGK